MTRLFDQKISVLNIGLQSFADNIATAGAPVSSIMWQPPAEGQIEAGLVLARLLNDPEVIKANEIAMERYLGVEPVLVDVQTAGDVLPDFRADKRLLHSGPPIAWQDMCGPVKGALMGAAVYEGWAKNVEDASRMLESGEIQFSPCHSYNAVGPMAGIISPSMPVWVVEDANSEARHRTFSNFNEGLGKVLRFGANSTEVLDRLRWIEQELAPTLQKTLQVTGPIELKPIMAQALHMGDEVHNRNAAATGILIKKLAPSILKTDASTDVQERVLSFLASNDHFFLNLSMAACKNMLNAAAGVPNSTMVTVMARNGVNFGIRMSGTGDQWFQAPANPVDGLFFPGYGVEDAAADLGDSAITETAGVGGFAMASSPAIVKFVGGTPQDATNNSRRMQSITLGTNPAFTLPPLNFAPTAAGIDAIKVVDRGVLPIINTGIAHKEAGVGQIGAGITTAPLQCFVEALLTLWAKRKGNS
ncbi:YlbE family protein [Pseudovibrio exalbescens]|uniref:DUF1116 domain-containing protein n=1 Tax=Pseudovibrio exalbescens TaxID=197461 RepID=A0A1U7JF30_9HYPH|nr:DUF1116 domain-containing protein [Pseudovibrio exalbescens]OKL43360.1 hypothetical protein A3843_14145 [Pseudovibrio exalbescens]